jgi:hypothetical protein
MRTIPRALGIGLTIGALACHRHARPVSREPAAGFADGFDANVRRDLETLRAATNKYHDLAAAEAAGYPTTMPKCIADSTMGGMGHHLIDRKAFDDALDIEHPEMLIYATDGEGKPELVAVEYVVPYRVLPATGTPPRLFGQELKRYDQYNYWALHVWAWRRNAAGLFADWNPAVKC